MVTMSAVSETIRDAPPPDPPGAVGGAGLLGGGPNPDCVVRAAGLFGPPGAGIPGEVSPVRVAEALGSIGAGDLASVPMP
jgi:hypothetical protein